MINADRKIEWLKSFIWILVHWNARSVPYMNQLTNNTMILCTKFVLSIVIFAQDRNNYIFCLGRSHRSLEQIPH